MEMLDQTLKKKALMSALGDLKSKTVEHSLNPLLSVKISVEGPGAGEQDDSEESDSGECGCGEPGCPKCGAGPMAGLKKFMKPEQE